MTALFRRLPSIIALSLAAVVAVVAAGLLVRLVELRSLSDVTGVLRLSGYGWAHASVDGLQVRLTGTAPTEALRFRALSAAGTVVDPARVIDEMQVTDKVLRSPTFSIEILRNLDAVSLIGLIPKASDRKALVERVRQISGVTEVVDLLETADHPQPEGWTSAVGFGLEALDALPRSKVSIEAGEVRVSAISDSAAEQRRIEADLARRSPDDIRVALDISAPRPAIAPFTLRFLIDGAGRPRFDACAADTDEARQAIVNAAVAAGMQGKANCVIGLGAPSPRWGEAAVAAIKAVAGLGGGSVTISDADVALVAPDTTPKETFDTVAGTLERALPEGFSLKAVLTEPVEVNGTGEGQGAPELVATLGDGKLRLRGRVRDAREQAVISGFAKAMFGAGAVSDTTRIDGALPEGWSLRVLAALEALRQVHEGGAVVQKDFVNLHGTTGLPEARADIARLFAARLGDGAHYEIDVDYVEKLDPVLGLPTPEECVAEINAAIAAKKISFAPGSATMEQGAGETMDKIAATMKNCSEVPMEVGGYTDSQGREEMNQQLSQSRAEAVIEALMARRVLTGSLTARGYGEENPIADNATEEGREANRRIAFRLVDAAAEAAAAEADPAAEPAVEEPAAEDAASPEDETLPDGDLSLDGSGDDAPMEGSGDEGDAGGDGEGGKTTE